MAVQYAAIADAVQTVGMVARGGFEIAAGQAQPSPIPDLSDGRRTETVVIVGNVGGRMWPAFAAGRRDEPDPLDAWTRRVLRPIAAGFGAEFVHPSDEPFQPFQQWAQHADDVSPSPIGLLVHPDHGLWHAYRGAFLLPTAVDGLPPVGVAEPPCLTCVGRPCLSTCPVDAFTEAGYDSVGCADHVRSGNEPACLTDGCAARRACPVGVSFHYGPDQMRFHMAAFAGIRA